MEPFIKEKNKLRVFLRILANIVWAVSLLTILVSCSSGGGDSSLPHFTIGGTVSGLEGSGLILQNNAGDDLSISANGIFTFSTSVISGTTYEVTVMTQPIAPSQTCSVSTGDGTVSSSDVIDVTIVCTTNTYSVGGMVSGLSGSGLLLQNNSGDDLSISANGTFTFATSVYSGENYSIAVKKHPWGLSQICTVSNGSGIVGDEPVNDVLVNCVIPSPRFAYVANYGSNNISAYTINTDTGALTEVAGSPFAAGVHPSSIAVDPSVNFAYVSNDISNTISAYSINASTGALTPVIGSPFADGTGLTGGTGPYSLNVDPSGNHLYAGLAHGYSNISVYTINQITGALTIGISVAAGTTPISITIDPSGKFLYAANLSSNNISVYTINQTTGELIAGTSVAAGTRPVAVITEPFGKFAYVANSGSNNILVYMIDQTTGALTAGSAVAAGTNPQSVAVDPLGKFAYAANVSSNNISVYTINQTTGALTAGTTVTAGTTPWSITVDPSGKFAYVTNGGTNTISVYTIDSSTGALTVGPAVATGTNPQHATITAAPQ